MRRAFLLLTVALVALMVWSGRPMGKTGGKAPIFHVPPGDSLEARRMSTILFNQLGVSFETVRLYDGELLLKLQPGSYSTRSRFEGHQCVHAAFADGAMRNVAVNAYRLYGRKRGVGRVTITAASDTASFSDWFHRGSCSGGTTQSFMSAQLDSLAGILPLSNTR